MSPRLALTAAGQSADLPELPAEAARAVLLAYADLVTGLAEVNAGRRGWWYSWLSSRDQFRCPLPGDLLWLARVEAWLAAGAEDGATLSCADGGVAGAVAARARRAGWRVEVQLAARLRWGVRAVTLRLGALADAAKAAAVGGLVWLAARRHPRPQADLAGNAVILVGWLDQALLRPADGPRADVYFGRLAAMLEQSGERVLHLGPVMAPPGRIGAVTAAAAAESGRLATIGHFLTLADVAAAVLAALAERVRLPAADRPLLRRALARRVVYSAQARMIEKAVARALAANPAARVIHLYENLPWERAVDLAAGRAGRDVVGYLHCAVLPSHLSYCLDQREAAIRPRPDRIVCTGPAARDVLLSLGRHDPATVLPGMALRDRDATLPPVAAARPARIRTVLVLLEALYKMVPLLQALQRAAALSPGLDLVVRAHPGLPFATLAAAAGLAAGRLRPSTAAGLREAIAAADLVVYQGTTAALTAAEMGLPLLWFDGGLPFTDDPLFRCPSFKRTFRRAEDLAPAVAAFEAMADAQWQAERDRLRAYAMDYARPPGPAGFDDFRIAPPPASAAQ